MVPNENPVSVVLYDASLQDDWNNYVSTSNETTIAHHLGWKCVVEDTFDHRPFYLMAYRQKRIVGLVPLFLVDSKIFGRFLVSSPFLTFGGIACEDEDVAQALLAKAAEIGRNHRVHYIEIRNRNQYLCLPHTKSDFHTLVLDLEPGIKNIWDSCLRPTTRRNVRIARREGLEVVECQKYLDTFVDINARNMHRLGTPAHGSTFFQNILKHFPESTLLMAGSGHSWIGGTLLVHFKDTVLMPWIGSRQEYLSMRPNNLLYWEAIKHAIHGGFRWIDFGRSKWDSGTFRFKFQYGAQPLPIYYQYYLHRANKIPEIDPSRPTFRPLITAWRKLPFFVANSIGPHIISHIP